MKALPVAAAALVLLAAAAPAYGANAYGPGCDPSREVTPPGPVVCAMETGYATSETSIAITNTGAVFFSPAHTENSVARSTDEGATWNLTYPPDQQYTALWNTVDPQFAVDRRTGRLFWIHATGHLRTAPFLVSQSPLPWEATTAIAYASGFQVYGTSDDGGTWKTADYSNEQMGDWEKVIVGPPVKDGPQPQGYPNVVYVCANSPFEVSGPGRLCYRSLDGGATFARAGYVFPSPSSPVDACPALATNTGVVTSDGAIYQPVSCEAGSFLAVSRDEGATYEWIAMKDAPPANALSGSLQVVADSADTLYATWQEGDAVKWEVSRDAGKTWTKPRVATLPDVKGTLFPAPAAGARGQFGIAYYGSTKAGADKLTAYMSATQDALAGEPVFHHAAINDPAKPEFHSYGFDATPRVDYIGAAWDPSGSFWAGAIRQLGEPNEANRIATTGLVGRLVWVADQGRPAPGGATLTGGRPKASSCVGRRRLIFRLGPIRGGRVVRAEVFVNGRRVLSRRGRRLTRVAFTRPRGSRLVVRIVTTNNFGGKVVTVRTYRGCKRSRLKSRQIRRPGRP